MPRFLSDPSLASLSDHARVPRGDPRRLALVLRRVPAASRRRAPAGVRPLRLLPPVGRRDRSRRRLGRRARAPARPARPRRPRAGRCPIAADRAMADLMRRYAIPRALPEALLEGLRLGRRGPKLRDARRTARLCGAGRRHGRRDDDAADGRTIARGAGSRLRPRRRDATDQHRPRRRRGRAPRPPLSADSMAAGSRRRPRGMVGSPGALRRHSPRRRAPPRGGADAL